MQKNTCEIFSSPYNAHPLSRQTASVVRLEKESLKPNLKSK